jgi:hypothetical protein
MSTTSEIVERLRNQTRNLSMIQIDGLLEEAADRIAQLESKFAHYHKGPGYRCAKCGLGLTDEIHLRVDDARAALAGSGEK